MLPLIRYDLKNGLIKRWGYIAIPIVIFSVNFIMHLSFIQDMHLTLGEYWLYVFQGGIPKVLPSIDWMLVHIGCLYFTLGYPVTSLEKFGLQITVRCGSKINWWLSKCLWNFICTLIYWLTGLLNTVILFLLFGFEINLEVRKNAVYNILSYFKMTQPTYGSHKTFFIFIVVPFLALVTINMLQMLASVFIGRILAFITGLFTLVLSAEFMIPLFPANYSMLQRSTLFLPSTLDYKSGALILLTETAVLIISGAVLFHSYDILESKGNKE